MYVGPLTTNFSTQFFFWSKCILGTYPFVWPKAYHPSYASSKLCNFILPEEMEDLLMWKEYDRVHLSLQKPLKTQIAFYGKHFSLSLKINRSPKATILGHICRFLGAKLDRWMKSRKPHIHGNEPWSYILCLREKGCQHATSQVADNVKGKCYPRHLILILGFLNSMFKLHTRCHKRRAFSIWSLHFSHF